MGESTLNEIDDVRKENFNIIRNGIHNKHSKQNNRKKKKANKCV